MLLKNNNYPTSGSWSKNLVLSMNSSVSTYWSQNWSTNKTDSRIYCGVYWSKSWKYRK